MVNEIRHFLLSCDVFALSYVSPFLRSVSMFCSSLSFLFYDVCLCVNGNNNEPLVRQTYKREEKRNDIHIALLSLLQRREASSHTHERTQPMSTCRRQTNDFERIETPPSSTPSKDSTDESSLSFWSQPSRRTPVNVDFDKVTNERAGIDIDLPGDSSSMITRVSRSFLSLSPFDLR